MDRPYAYCFKPIPTSINSVSKRLGGIVTIGVSNLQPGTTNLIVKLGNNTCVFNKYDSENKIIQCTLPPSPNVIESAQLNQLPLAVQIGNGIGGICKNDNILNFTYGIPTLSSTAIVKQSGRLVTITGTNLALPLETSVIITGQGDDIEIEPTSINKSETSLVFELPSLKCETVTLYVKSKRVSAKSSSITFNANFEVQVTLSPFVYNGTNIEMNLLFVTCPLTASTPTVSVNNSIFSTCSTLIDGNPFYSSKCQVPPGTGKDHPIKVFYNSKSFQSTYSYAASIIYESIVTDSNITIIGLNFGSTNSLFSAFYLNRTVEVIGTITDSKFVFSRNESDINSNITITVDNIVGNPYPIKLLPIIKESMNITNILSTSGDTITITGINFESSLSFENPEYKIQIIANSLVQVNYTIVNDNVIIVNIPNLNSSTLELSFIVGGNHQQVQSTNYKFAIATIESVSPIQIEIGKVISSFKIIGNNFRNDYQVIATGIDDGSLIFNCDLIYHNPINNVTFDKLICNSTLPVKSLLINFNNISVNFGTDIKLEKQVEYNITVADVDESSSYYGVGSHLLPTVITVLCLFISISLL